MKENDLPEEGISVRSSKRSLNLAGWLREVFTERRCTTRGKKRGLGTNLVLPKGEKQLLREELGRDVAGSTTSVKRKKGTKKKGTARTAKWRRGEGERKRGIA